MPLLSVIIPVYNVAPFLDDCLNSITSQGFSDMEIICVDDGSTDDCSFILDKWAKKDNRLRVIHQQNQGLSSARNTGLRFARGKYLSFVDSDDLVRKDIYTASIPLMLKNQLDVLLFSFETFPERKLFPIGLPTYDVMDCYQVFSANDFIQTNNILCFSWRFLFKTSVIADNNLLFDEKVRIGEDMIFNIEVLCHSKRIMAIDAPLYLYRKDNTNSLMSQEYKLNLESSYTRMYAKKQEQIQRFGLQGTSYCFDLARYTILTYLTLFIKNVYRTPETIDRIAEIKRIHSLNMFQDAFGRIGFRNIGLTWKEYLFFLAQKFRLWNIILPRYNRMFKR